MSLCNEIAIRTFLEREFSRMPDRCRGVLLDLGCGTQPYRSLYHKVFQKIVAADYASRSRLDATVDVCALPFLDGTVDVVLFTEVVEHVVEGLRAFREISRVLKPGGVLLLTWPFIYPLHELPRDYVRYTEFAISEFCRRSGLEVQVLERRGDIFSVGGTLVEQFLFNAIELGSRCPWIGPIFLPLSATLRHVLNGLWKGYFRITGKSDRFHPQIPGAHLKGTVNHLALWTLGYCARITKLDGMA